MKKITVFLLAMLMMVIPVFADKEWEGDRTMAITMSPTPLIIGTIMGGFGLNAGFELALHKSIAVKANLYYIGFDPLQFIGFSDDMMGLEEGGTITSNVSLFRANAEARYYLDGMYLEGWFINLGAQFHRISASARVTLDEMPGAYAETGIGFNTFGVCAGAGYKMILGTGRVGFVMEASLDYTHPIFTEIPQAGDFSDFIVGSLLGTKGFRASLIFGAAF
jgi:hypothetical protein